MPRKTPEQQQKHDLKHNIIHRIEQVEADHSKAHILDKVPDLLARYEWSDITQIQARYDAINNLLHPGRAEVANQHDGGQHHNAIHIHIHEGHHDANHAHITVIVGETCE